MADVSRRLALFGATAASMGIFSLGRSDFVAAAQEDNLQREPIELEYPEVYELANIVLALTDYGLEDPWQVQKEFDFYDTMRAWFDPFRGHPVIQDANFSRERWMEYLSFRTDAYAFRFDENDRLVRTGPFRSFDISTFDDHLAGVEDFARQSNFRDFFARHGAYRAGIINRYRTSYMLDEMRAFLEAEFGPIFENRRYVVALSPFVYAQNLHRDIDETLTVDFPTIANSIVNNQDMAREDQASEIHTLFTEMDHGYVNPTTARYADIVSQVFDSSVWAGESGYEAYRNGVFNEYMTWAVYDLFVEQMFPDLADQVSFDWHVQNESRGFRYSHYFAQLLRAVYAGRAPGQTLRDLYPALLRRITSAQGSLSKPTITNASLIHATRANVSDWVTIEFSEPMIAKAEISYTILNGNRDRVSGTLEGPDVRWASDARSVGLRLAFEPSVSERHGILFNDFGAVHRLKNPMGIMLEARAHRLVQAVA